MIPGFGPSAPSAGNRSNAKGSYWLTPVIRFVLDTVAFVTKVAFCACSCALHSFVASLYEIVRLADICRFIQTTNWRFGEIGRLGRSAWAGMPHRAALSEIANKARFIEFSPVSLPGGSMPRSGMATRPRKPQFVSVLVRQAALCATIPNRGLGIAMEPTILDVIFTLVPDSL